MNEEWRRLEQSVEAAFLKAEQLNELFEKSQKPRQRKIVEILHKHRLPAFIGPFFDAYFRITVQGGDVEKLSLVVVARLAKHLKEDPTLVARRHKAAVSDYIEYMSEDLGEQGSKASSEQFMPLDG